MKVSPGQRCLYAIHSEHECPKFVQWHPGKNPKEHEDMTILEQVQSEQERFRTDEIRRREKWHEEDSAGARTTRIIAIFSAAGTIAASIVAGISLYVSLSVHK